MAGFDSFALEYEQVVGCCDCLPVQLSDYVAHDVRTLLERGRPGRGAALCWRVTHDQSLRRPQRCSPGRARQDERQDGRAALIIAVPSNSIQMRRPDRRCIARSDAKCAHAARGLRDAVSIF